MNKGNIESELRAELATWHEPDEHIEPDYDLDDYELNYYYDQCRDGWGSYECEAYDYWSESELSSNAQYYWDDYFDYVSYHDNDWDDEYWHRLDTDDFAHDASGNASHYKKLWAAVGYIPRYIPFPFPVRTVVGSKLIECYRPPNY